jgi:hypothetical protein
MNKSKEYGLTPRTGVSFFGVTQEKNQVGEPIKVGYARVSTDEQKMDMQINALRRAGCTHIYIYRSGDFRCCIRKTRLTAGAKKFDRW